jgi:hypothetical protein
MTNDPFNGGDMSYASLATDGLAKLALDSINVRGRYRITRATDNQLEVTGVSSRYPGVGVRVYVTEYDIDSSRVSYVGALTF